MLWIKDNVCSTLVASAESFINTNYRIAYIEDNYFEDHNAGRTPKGLNYFFNDELHIGADKFAAGKYDEENVMSAIVAAVNAEPELRGRIDELEGLLDIRDRHIAALRQDLLVFGGEE